MPLTTMTPEEQWACDVLEQLGQSVAAEQHTEASNGSSLEGDEAQQLAEFERNISQLTEKSDILKQSKAHSTTFKNLDETLRVNVKKAQNAIEKNNQEAIASTFSELKQSITSLTGMIESAEESFVGYSQETDTLRQEYSEYSKRKAAFARRAYFSKRGTKKMNKFNSICEKLSRKLDHLEDSLQAGTLDEMPRTLKSCSKTVHQIQKEVDWLEASETQIPESLRVDEKKLQGNLETDYVKNKESWRPQICYNAAIRVGVIEGNLTEYMRQILMSGNTVDGYPVGYAELMGISEETVEKLFDDRKIEESGIMNFRDDRSGRISHTAYLQKTRKETVELYHTNCQTLDMALLGDATTLPKSGPVTHYNLSDPDTQSRFQDWLDSGYSFKHTPASQLK